MLVPAQGENKGLTPDRMDRLEVPLLLRNRNQPASNGAFFERLCPVTGKVVSRAAAATISDASAAVASAASAFPRWSAVGPSERRARLLEAAAIVEAARGVRHRHGDGDRRDRRLGAVQRRARRRHAARGGRDDDADRRRGDPFRQAGHASRWRCVSRSASCWASRPGTRRSSWACARSRCRSPAATPSCSRPRKSVPRTHRLIGECLCEAGFDDGVVNVITNAPEDAPEIVEALIAHPAVRRINFTGSTRVGRIIARDLRRDI